MVVSSATAMNVKQQDKALIKRIHSIKSVKRHKTIILVPTTLRPLDNEC